MTNYPKTFAVLLAMCVIPVLYWSVTNDDTIDILLGVSATIGFPGLFVWFMATGPDPVSEDKPHVNAAGDTVLAIPSALAPILPSRHEFALLVDAQVRNGGIPVPIPGDVFKAVLQLDRDYVESLKETTTPDANEKRVVKRFMAAVFLATRQEQDRSTLVGRGAEKC